MAGAVFRTKNFVADAANFIVDLAHKALAERHAFRIALSGGNTPRPVYSEIARIGRDLPWERILITFGDERCVPPDDAQSNFRMARETLFVPASVPEKSIMRMRGEIDPQIAAQQYQDDVDLLATQRGEQIYRHDLILLGLGDDGHTASLFPDSAALNEATRRVVANFVAKLNVWRLTFTFPLINHARHVCFLVNASKQAKLIDRVISGDPQFPASRVNPTAGKLTWILGEGFCCSTTQLLNLSTSLILLAFVRRRRHAILNRPGVNHYADPIKHQQSNSESGGSNRGQNSEDDSNRSNDEQNDRPDNPMTFVNVTESGNHAEQYCHRIARFWFRRLGRFERPITVGARLCV